jgi:3-oxoacyl-[acyl-carrier protein] reductase
VDVVTLFSMMKMETLKKSFEVNFFAQMSLTQKISRMMIAKKRGTIVNLSSVAGIDGDTGMLDYVSGKAAMIGATKRLAIELGSYNIRVNAVAPGLIDTDMGNQMTEELTKETIGKSIMNRKGNPSEIANVIVFLTSEMSSFMTGQTIRVDGGII